MGLSTTVRPGFARGVLGGMPKSMHPLRDKIDFGGCGACGSDDVLVVSAQHEAHPDSADEIYEYEVACQDCRKITARRYDPDV